MDEYEDQARKVAEDRAYRARLINSGHIRPLSARPLSARPTLWLAPGERERFEREAHAQFDAWSVS